MIIFINSSFKAKMEHILDFKNLGDWRPTPEQIRTLKMAKSGIPGVYTLLEKIPVDHLERNHINPNVFQLKNGTETAKLVQIVAIIGLTASTVQMTNPANFDENGQRKPENHLLVIFVN